MFSCKTGINLVFIYSIPHFCLFEILCMRNHNLSPTNCGAQLAESNSQTHSSL
ncbi:DUF6783 domain-containing protein [Blautia sp. JLR.GB0024]|uniref:DUF6783 domain-containing protein n=1 Tax=Blautia sp. JLR.GB0024 TaxID=3123295 RepID=UPI003FA57C95